MKRSLVILCIFVSVAFSQKAAIISGTVVDSENSEPLINAKVSVQGIRMSDTTDQEGKFTLGPLPPGFYILEASHIGYRSKTTSVQITHGNIEHTFELIPRMEEAGELIVTRSRARSNVMPVTFTDVPETALRDEWSVPDIPMVLQRVAPGLYAFSEAGNGIGYSHLRIRGFHDNNISVLINGIPQNDPEDHVMYWTFLPGFTASLQDIQVQRGIGTSLMGTGGLGGTVDLSTRKLPADPGVMVTGGLGDYGVKDFSFRLSSISSRSRSLYARFSRILSDGYRKKSDSDLWSYFFAGQADRGAFRLRFNAYGGPVKVNTAGSPASEDSLALDRRFNPVSYDNEILDFNQPHYELHVSHTLSERSTVSAAAYYTRENGYAEQLITDAELRNYGIVPEEDDTTTADLIRQKNRSMYRIGILPRYDWNGSWLEAGIGGGFEYFRRKQHGDILWTEYTDTIDARYYRHRSQKISTSGYLQLLAHAGPRIDFSGELGVQMLSYSFQQQKAGNFVEAELNRFEDDYTFFSPRIGLTVRPHASLALYTRFSTADREPALRDYFGREGKPDELFLDPVFESPDTVFASTDSIDYVKWSDPVIEPEHVQDIEIGATFESSGFRAGAAAYFMTLESDRIRAYQSDYIPSAYSTFDIQESEYRGFECFLSTPPLNLLSGYFRLRVNGSLHESEITQIEFDPENPLGGTAGNPVPFFPEYLFGAGLSYAWRSIDIGFRLDAVGRQYLDMTGLEERSIDPFTKLGMSATFGPVLIGGLGLCSLEARIDNLTDMLYETAGYYNPEEDTRYFWPGSERTFHIGLSVEM